MATAESAAGADTGTQVVGTVVIIYGNAKALSIDGTERVLGPNSPIFSYDRVITESDAMLSIIIDDPAQSQIDIGRMSHIIIDEDIFAGVTAEDVAAAAAEVEQIQEALLAEGFDPTVELEAPAAGTSPAAGGGHPVPDFARTTHEGEITSGAETTGIITDTVDPIDGVVEVDDVNDPPVAIDDNETTPEDTPVTLDLTSNDTDLDGTIDPTTVNIVTGPSNGTLVNNGDGTVTYIPNEDYNGPDSFTYTVQDDDGDTSNEATVAIGVTPVNDDFTDADEVVSTPEDTPISDNVLTGTSSVDGDVTVTAFTVEGTDYTPGNTATVTGVGSLTIAANGDYTFTPEPDYNGPVPVATYTMTDGSSGDTSTLTIGVTPVNDAPVVGSSTATVSEEGLGEGIQDTNGTPDTTDSATASGKVVFSDVDTTDTHSVTLSTPATPLTSNDTAITWTGNNTQTLTGMAGSATIVIVTINNDGDYTVNLQGPIDHSDPDSEDVVSFIVPVNVSDGTDTSFGSLTVNIEDDSPTIFADYDAVIANEQGNSLTVPLDINFGADGPHATNPIQLNGPTVDGFVVNNNGEFVTSDGVNLIYQSDGNGGLIAVKEGTGTPIFSIAVDPVAETYTVTIHGPLDGAAGTEIDLTTGGTDPGNDAEVYFYGGEDSDSDGLEDIQIRITGYDENGEPGEVNSSKPGMGVNNNWLNNLVDENPEQLFMVFSDTTNPNDPYAMTAAEITVNSLDGGEQAVWKLYNTNGYTSDEFKADPTLWDLVNDGTAPGSASANTSFIVEGGVNPATGLPYTFDAIVLEASDGGEYRVLNATTFTTDSGSNTTISYDSPGLQLFDADGDQNETAAGFDVTFDADGNITGTNANESIAGSSHTNMIYGGDGDDIIYGHEGDDTIDGGPGDDTLTGGSGADTFKVAEGDDTITDYNEADDDIVDISDMFEPVDDDTLAVNENPDGSVKLSVLNSSGDEKGSVSFENIEFANLDSDPGVDLNGDGDMNELDSLLGQVDIDDGII